MTVLHRVARFGKIAMWVAVVDAFEKQGVLEEVRRAMQTGDVALVMHFLRTLVEACVPRNRRFIFAGRCFLLHSWRVILTARHLPLSYRFV